MRHVAIGMIALVLAVPIAGATDPPYFASFTATSVHTGPITSEADAFLVGMGTDLGRDNLAQWDFQAAEAEVVVTREDGRRIGLVWYPEGRTISTAVHTQASGILTHIDPHSYLVAQSARPFDPRATFRADLAMPDAAFSPAPQFEFVSMDEYLYEKYEPDSETMTEYRVQHDWPNLGYAYAAPDTPITLHGDFRVIVFGMEFRIDSAEGSTSYWTGSDWEFDPMVLVEDGNMTRAEIIFRDATFTLRPEGFPVDLYAASAILDIDGSARFEGAQGMLQTRSGETRLDDARVQLRGDELQAALRPVPGPAGANMIFDVDLAGGVDTLAVDGRVLDLGEGEGALPQPETTVETPVPPSVLWLGLVPFVAVLGVAARKGGEECLVRRMPDRAAGRAERAFDKGRHRRAINLSGRVLARHPRHARSAAIHACGLLAQGTPRAAATVLEHLSGAVEDEGQISLLHCVSLHLDGRTQLAGHRLADAAREFPALGDVLKGVMPCEGSDDGGSIYV